MPFKLKPLVAVGVLVCSMGAADAAVRYEFTALSSFPYDVVVSLQGAFTLTVDDFIVPTDTGVTIAAAGLDSCSVLSPAGYACGDITIASFEDLMESVGFGIAGRDFGIAYYFDKGAFSTAGTHLTSDLTGFGDAQSGTLTVTVVPEPGVAAMLVAGLGLLAWLNSRNRPQRATTRHPVV